MQPHVIAGRYRVVREIGRGGMGTVWLCRDERLDRDVAIKQVGGFPGETQPQVRRALREARSAAALQHPGVVSVFDAVEEGGHIWLVMEFVPSQTLSRLTRDEGPLPPRRVARIGAQVAAGLAAAHARNIVHRDVKPGNVLVADGDTAKISDFGIARTLGDEHLTQTGLVTGTPAYFSPELARGQDPDAASDVWALGATLYAAVEGRSPYPEKTNAIAMLSQIAHDSPRRPERAGPLNEAIGRMMNPDPEQRWSMAEVADALRRIGAAGEAEQPTTTAEDSDRTRAFTAPAVVAGGAAGAAEAAADEEPDAAESAPEPEPEPEADPVPAGAAAAAPAPAPRAAEVDDGRGRGVLVALLGLVLVAAMLIGGIWLSQRGGGEDPVATDPGSSEPADAGSEEPGDVEPTDSSSTEDDPADDPADDPSEESSEEPDETAPAGSPGAAVEDYYALLPGDPEAAWDRLSPELQDQVGSYGTYAGFWGTIDAVRVDGTTPVGEDQVDVTVTYSTDRGTESEVRRIRVGGSEDEPLLTGDEVVG